MAQWLQLVPRASEKSPGANSEARR
jgi:hypothetical protein